MEYGLEFLSLGMPGEPNLTLSALNKEGARSGGTQVGIAKESDLCEFNETRC